MENFSLCAGSWRSVWRVFPRHRLVTMARCGGRIQAPINRTRFSWRVLRKFATFDLNMRWKIKLIGMNHWVEDLKSASSVCLSEQVCVTCVWATKISFNCCLSQWINAHQRVIECECQRYSDRMITVMRNMKHSERKLTSDLKAVNWFIWLSGVAPWSMSSILTATSPCQLPRYTVP